MRKAECVSQFRYNRAIMTPVCIIGLDGVDWRLLRGWLSALPTLARLCAEGTTGNLRSTIRPESSVAWSSFATGVNPGKHGVYGFMVQTSPGRFQIANGATIRTARFWETLSAAGRRVALLNVPFTYPVRPINGALISGMMTPGLHADFAYPPELKSAFVARFPAYPFDPDSSHKTASAVSASVEQTTEQQLDAALWLLQREAWDCFGVVFTGPDRLQHFAWNGPDRLLAHYRQLDAAVAKILAQLPADALTLIISDHGFNGVAGRFYGNQWLAENGWLRFKAGASRGSLLLKGVRKAQKIGWLRELKRHVLPAEVGASSLAASQFGARIDWANTRAYFAPDGGVHVNLRGREPHGIVVDYAATRAQLQSELAAICRNDVPLFANVFTRDELYAGDVFDGAPDLVAEPQRETATTHFVLDSSAKPQPSPFGDATPYQATHALDGILIAHGTNVATGSLNANIIDIAPTVLAVQGVAVPDNVDGRPLVELFAEPPEIAYQATGDVVQDGAQSADDAAVAERLRQLGYIDS